MHVLKCQPPCPALRPFVRVFAQREIGPSHPDVVEPIPARLEQALELQLGEHFEVIHANGFRHLTPANAVIGAQLGGSSIRLGRGVMSFGIFFQPAGFSTLFGIPIIELSRRHYCAADLLGDEIVRLQNRLREEKSFERRALVAENFLLRLSAQSRAEDPMDRVIAYIFNRRGVVRIADVARLHGLGERHFERRFSARTGFAPKLFARIARFQTALDAKVAIPQRSWLDIAHELGYHDQMHLIRDFHSLAGDTPGKILSSIGDARPSALTKF